MAISKAVVGAVGAAALGVGVLVASVSGRPPSASPVAVKKNVPKDAKHLWANGGAGLREPQCALPDGGCLPVCERCLDGRCARNCD